jgi:hypothetical protein
MKLLLAIINRPRLDLPVSALPLQRQLAVSNISKIRRSIVSLRDELLAGEAVYASPSC